MPGVARRSVRTSRAPHLGLRPWRSRASLVAVLLAIALWPGAGFAEGEARRDLRLGDPVPAAAAFAAAADRWGFDLALDDDVAAIDLRVDLERVTREEALDLLSAAAEAFWWLSADGTVHVAHASPQKRSAVIAESARSYRLERAVPQEVVTALRTLLSTHAEAGEGVIEAEVWEPLLPDADAVVATMDAASPGWSLRWLGSEMVDTVAPPDPALGTEAPRRLWFPDGAPVESLVRAIEAAWDIDLVTDPAILHSGATSLRLPSATLFEALDALTVPMELLWTPLGDRRILLTHDTSRRFRHWVLVGLGSFRLQRAETRRVQHVLRELGLLRTATGSSPPMIVVLGNAVELAVARFVVETIDGEGPLSSRTGGRLWLGSHDQPRLIDAQRIVDPTTAEERRLALAAAAPPQLGPDLDRRHVHPAGPEPLVRKLARDMGLHVGVSACCGVEAPAIRRMMVDAVQVSDRASASRHLADDPSLLWTVIGPDTVILAPNNGYSRRHVAHRGVAAVPLAAHQAAVRALAEELELEAVAELAAPHPLLFATGRWEDLGALLDAAAGPAETVGGPAGGVEAAPAPSPSAPSREDG